MAKTVCPETRHKPLSTTSVPPPPAALGISAPSANSPNNIDVIKHLDVNNIKRKQKRSKHKINVVNPVDNDNSNLVDDYSNQHSVADDGSVIRLDPHIIIFQNEDSLRNSDFQNRETSTTSPFDWVQIPPLHSSQIETVDDAGADECQHDVRFPRSFFSFFKDKSNFPLSAASQYCVDKFSALQGYLSVNPQFNVEIFHNAGINKCCERAPPLLIVVFKKREKRRTKNFYVLFQN